MKKGGEWFKITKMAQANIIRILDHTFEAHLQSKSCKSFENFTYLESPSLSFTILQNSTFFKCKNDSLGVQFGGFSTYHCKEDIIYYNFLKEGQSIHPGSLPPQCSVIQLLVNLSKLPKNQMPNCPCPCPCPFTYLTAEISLEYHFSSNCFECLSKGGQCQDLTEKEFHCAGLKKGKSKLPLILSTVISGVTTIFLACLLILWHRNIWKYVSSYFPSKNSSDSSKADLEEGSVYFGVPVFSYKELEEATNIFNPSKELGDGGFGTVYYGKLRDGREVAVKRLYEHNYKRVEQFMNEIKILTRLRHRHLVSLYGCTSRRSRELLLVYEYIPNGTVADHLHGDKAKPGSLTWPIRMNIAIETASALAYLHASDIIHRDVKTDNILIDNHFCVKVADFGLSRLFPIDVTHVSTAPQGTPGYVDPEYHQCYQLTDKSDVYSFGVVLIELISSMPAVDISRHRHEINLANLAINRIQKGAFDELIDPSLGFQSDTMVYKMTTSVAELAFQCLQHEKDMRPSMDEVFEALKEIQGEECQEEQKGEVIEPVGAQKSTIRPPFSPESDDVVLLKKTELPPSPDCVADKWDSTRSTTPNTSG